MKELLAIDYGKARCGLALASVEAAIAVPYRVVATKEIVETVRTIMAERQIVEIIVGLPRTLTGQDTPQTEVVRKFGEHLKREIDIPVIFSNEGLSTRLAESLGEGRDDEAAALILAAYLEKGLTE